MKSFVITVFVIFVLGAGAVWVYATPTIGTIMVAPTTVAENISTTIMVTAVITDPLILPQSVTLVRVTSSSSTVVGYLHDDGLGGDAVAGDHVFTALINLNEVYPGPIMFQISAAFSGLLRRVMSPPITIIVQGVTLSNVLNRTQHVVQGGISSMSSYYMGSDIFTDLTLNVSNVIRGSSLPATIIVRTFGGTVGGETQLPTNGLPFVIGQQILLLLGDAGPDGKYVLSNGPAGIFRIQKNTTSQTIAVVDPAYDGVEQNFLNDPTWDALLSQSSQGQLTLDALTSAVMGAN